MQDAGVRCSSCCLGGKDLALLAPAVQNFMENFKLEMKMLNRLMMDQQNTGVCGAGWRIHGLLVTTVTLMVPARRHMAGCSMPLAEWQPKHLASGTYGRAK